MVGRRAPRTAWLPAILLWSPLLIAGFWFMAGIRFDKTSYGDGVWGTQLILPSPTSWFATPMAWLGVVLLLAGLVLWGVSIAQPDARRWLVIARYPEFGIAGHLLLVAAFMSVVDMSSNIFDAAAGGFTWVSVASIRSTANLWIAGILAVLALGCYALSVGGAWRVRLAR